MPKYEARELRPGMTILDQLDREAELTFVSSYQGEGLGYLACGFVVASPSRASINRYVEPTEKVEVLFRNADD